MSIQSEINRIAGAKSDIADAIEDMGGTLSPGASIDDLAAGVLSIPQSGTSDYDSLTNKPQINGVTLTGDKTLAQIGAAAQSDVDDLADITGDGQLSGFTATDLTGAANELKNTLTQLKTDTFSTVNLTGTNTTGGGIPNGFYFYNNGSLVKAKTDIQNGSAITIGTNAETVTVGGAYDVFRSIMAEDMLSKVYYLEIPYTASLQDNIIGMLEKAVTDGLFKNAKIFIGKINPAGIGPIFGYMYMSGGKWYGYIFIVYATSAQSGIYICNAEVWSKIT